MKPVDFLFSPGILKVPVSYIQHVDTGTFIYIYLSYTCLLYTSDAADE